MFNDLILFSASKKGALKILGKQKKKGKKEKKDKDKASKGKDEFTYIGSLSLRNCSISDTQGCETWYN